MRLLGHPLHPMLVHFPIAFWSAGSACDMLTLAGWTQTQPIASLAIGAGDAVAIFAMVAGLIDYAALDERLVPAAMRHIAWMASAWLLYAIALFGRLGAGDGAPLWSTLCSFVGFAALLGGAWQGGDLVYRGGAGVAH